MQQLSKCARGKRLGSCLGHLGWDLSKLQSLNRGGQWYLPYRAVGKFNYENACKQHQLVTGRTSWCIIRTERLEGGPGELRTPGGAGRRLCSVSTRRLLARGAGPRDARASFRRPFQAPVRSPLRLGPSLRALEPVQVAVPRVRLPSRTLQGAVKQQRPRRPPLQPRRVPSGFSGRASRPQTGRGGSRHAGALASG